MKDVEKEQEKAAQDLQALLNSTRPKNLVQGVSSGLNNVLLGAIGGIGALVLAPTVGMKLGVEKCGVLGGAAGLAGGLVIGVVGGAASIVGGE